MNILLNNLYKPEEIETPFGKKEIIYADHTASSLPFKPIEKFMTEKIYPYYANTHSNSFCGQLMDHYIEQSKEIIKSTTGTTDEHIIIFTGDGCSGAIVHFRHLLKVSTSHVFIISDFEHNSNFLPWQEMKKQHGCVVEIIPSDELGMIKVNILDDVLKKHLGANIVVSISAGSNVTGICQDLKLIGKTINKRAIYCVDYACVGPYVNINLKEDMVDTAFISPHKFLGGVGTCGILIVKKDTITNECPFKPFSKADTYYLFYQLKDSKKWWMSFKSKSNNEVLDHAKKYYTSDDNYFIVCSYDNYSFRKRLLTWKPSL